MNTKQTETVNVEKIDYRKSCDAMHLSRYSKTTEIHGKQASLIGYWIDLAAYYSDGTNAWSWSNGANYGGAFVNLGPVEVFKTRLANGQYRGKLI